MLSKPAVVNVEDNSTTVYAGKCYLFGVYVNTALSDHALEIKNGTTTLVTIPAEAAAGSHFSFPGILFDTSLIVDPDNSATGSITVAYAPVGWAGL